ncbi:GAF domain-containing protein [Nostoc sp. HG1]|nr:GAF domain-containing protein [Nostoc sp. HG1]
MFGNDKPLKRGWISRANFLRGLGDLLYISNLIVPLLREKELWGLLCIHQCSEPRDWKESEIEFIRQIADRKCDR